MLSGLKEIWQIFNSPGNEPVVVGLGVGWFALVVSQAVSYISYRRVLGEKDRRIEDLVEQRNKFQDIALAHKGLTRLSTKTSK